MFGLEWDALGEMFGAVGMAVVYSRLDIALSISLIVFLTLWGLTPIERKLLRNREIDAGKANSEANPEVGTHGLEADPRTAEAERRDRE
jgi:hypothetical protein